MHKPREVHKLDISPGDCICIWDIVCFLKARRLSIRLSVGLCDCQSAPLSGHSIRSLFFVFCVFLFCFVFFFKWHYNWVSTLQGLKLVRTSRDSTENILTLRTENMYSTYSTYSTCRKYSKLFVKCVKSRDLTISLSRFSHLQVHRWWWKTTRLCGHFSTKPRFQP